MHRKCPTAFTPDRCFCFLSFLPNIDSNLPKKKNKEKKKIHIDTIIKFQMITLILSNFIHLKSLKLDLTDVSIIIF